MMYWTNHLLGGPRRVNHAAVTIGKNIFTFGGYCSGVDYNTFKPIDIHILDTVKLKWLKLKIDGTNNDPKCIPFQRYGHTAVAQGSKIYLWGGRNDTQVCNTLYCFDTETLKWSKPNVYGKIPVPRDGHSACIIQNCMYIFGGFQENPSQFSQDLFMLNLHTMIWSIIKTQGRQPSYRDFHTATAIGNKMYIFGGRGDLRAPLQSDREVYCHNIHYFDTTTRVWETPVVYNEKPLGRRSHSAFVHNGFLYIFGGFNRNLDLHFQDIKRYDPVNSTWMTITPKGTSPCARRRQICQVVNDRVFISGGTSPIPCKIPLRLQDYDLANQVLNHLKDHDDLHVLDLNPSLIDMCLVNTWDYMKTKNIKIDDLSIPLSLKKNLANFEVFETKSTEVNTSFGNEFPLLLALDAYIH